MHRFAPRHIYHKVHVGVFIRISTPRSPISFRCEEADAMSAAAFAMSAANIASRFLCPSGFQPAFFCSPAFTANCVACDSFWHHIVCFQYLDRAQFQPKKSHLNDLFQLLRPPFRHPLKASTTGNVCPRSFLQWASLRHQRRSSGVAGTHPGEICQEEVPRSF